MRVMVIVKATKESKAGVMPSEELLTTMGKYNEELVKAGIMLAGDGLLKLGRFEGARTEFETTASMTRNAGPSATLGASRVRGEELPKSGWS